MANLIIPLKDNPEEEYEEPIDPRADGLLAAGFYPQNPDPATPHDALVGIDRDASGNLVFRDPVSGVRTLAQVLAPPRLAPAQTIDVAKSDAEFTSVSEALDAISDASISKPYVLRVFPGLYVEPPLLMKPYVDIQAVGGFLSTFLQTNDNATHFITGAAGASLTGVTLIGPTGPGYAAIHYSQPSYLPFFVDSVTIRAGYYGILAHADAPGANGSFALVHALRVVNWFGGSPIQEFVRTTGYAHTNVLFAAVMAGPPGSVVNGYVAVGPNTTLSLDQCTFRMAGGNDALYADDGAQVRANGCSWSRGACAIHVGPNGSGTKVAAASNMIDADFTHDIRIETADCHVQYSGTGRRAKVDLVDPASLSASFTEENVGQVVWGDLWLGTVGDDFPLGSFTRETAQTGHIEGGQVSRVAGLQVIATAGSGFVSLAAGSLRRVTWPETTLTLDANRSVLWIVVDVNGTVLATDVQPDPGLVIILGDVATSDDLVTFLASRHVALYDRAASQHVYARDVMGPLHVSGGAVTAPTPGTLQLAVDSCTYYIYDNRKTSAAVSPISFTRWYRDGAGGWKLDTSVSAFSNYWDDGSGTLALIPEGKWKRSTLYVAVNDGGTEFHAVLSQELWDNPAQALSNPIPPDIVRQKALLLAAMVSTLNSTEFYAIIDQRQKLGQFATNSTAVTAHNQLAGLSADDHRQYQLRIEQDQPNGYAGLDAEGKLPGTVLDLSTQVPQPVAKGAATIGASTALARADHAHDATTATPITIGMSNAEGVATSLARSDHVHSHGNLAGGTLHAAATQAVAGFMSAADKARLDGIRDALVQTQFTSLGVDVSTTARSWVDLMSLTVTTVAGTKLVCQSTASMYSTNNGRFIFVRLLVDDVAQIGMAMRYDGAPATQGTLLEVVEGLAAGSHVVKLQWYTDANTAGCRPASLPGNEHATLMVQEVRA